MAHLRGAGLQVCDVDLEAQDIRISTLKRRCKHWRAVPVRGRVKGAAADLLKEDQAICRQPIRNRLRSTKAPVWPDIVFGR